MPSSRKTWVYSDRWNLGNLGGAHGKTKFLEIDSYLGHVLPSEDSRGLIVEVHIYGEVVNRPTMFALPYEILFLTQGDVDLMMAHPDVDNEGPDLLLSTGE